MYFSLISFLFTTANGETVGSNNNVEIKIRSSVGFQMYVYTGFDDNLLIKRNGEIRGWMFYSKYAGKVEFPVWRRKEAGNYK